MTAEAWTILGSAIGVAASFFLVVRWGSGMINARIDDEKKASADAHNAIGARIETLDRHVNKRIDDLRSDITGRLNNMDGKIDRIVQSVAAPPDPHR